MKTLEVAIYARVSSVQQTENSTIESQLVALRTRVKTEGFSLSKEQEFIDEGYSGATLIRPALEKLRDLVATAAIDRVYVHSPDRLARKYAYQVVLVDEFARAGVEVVFLNRELGQSPEDDLLLQVQGMVAEYERAKIIERSRRGKRHAAQIGKVSVLSCAPYGYRYVNKYEGNGEARFEIVLEEAEIVKQIFEWVAIQRVTLSEVCRRLQKLGAITRTGKSVWDRTTIWGIIKNPVYKGEAAFGKTRIGTLKPRLRAYKGSSLQPRRAYTVEDMPKEQWLSIPVPAIIESQLFETIAEQLAENRKLARGRKRGISYLLQGLVVCKICEHAYYGKPISPSASKGHTRSYAYYRCIGTDAYRFGGERICCNLQVRTDKLDQAVWLEVVNLLKNPQRLEQEYLRRIENQPSKLEQDKLSEQINKLRKAIARLIDAYAEGLIDKTEFEPRISKLKERINKLENQIQQINQQANMCSQLKLIIGRLEDFASKISHSLCQADWSMQRELIRLLVKRIEIDLNSVNVVFRIEGDFFSNDSRNNSLQHCWKRDFTVDE